MPFQRGVAARNLLSLALIAILGLTFAADLVFPLGTAVWVIYLVPTVLAFLSDRPWVPVASAAMATVLTIAGFYLAPAGVDPSVAMVNRTLATLVEIALASLGVMFIRYRNEAVRQQWLRDGEAGLALAVGGEQGLDDLGRAALRYIAGRTGASAGAIYVRDGEGFRRIAALGVPESAPLPQRLSRDDGIAMRAVDEGRTITIDQVPDGYFSFGSALGRARPGRLVIGVTEVDGTVNAVVELGFLGEADVTGADVAAYLDLVRRQLGVAIRSGKYRAQLQALLAETQQQAEELQAQGEELRANNDELEAQTRALQAAQGELEQQQAELERSNVQLEEQARSLEAQRDELERVQVSLKAQAGELELASRYKSEFLANMSHELRTPLNSLLIMARLLADNRGGNLTGEQVRFAQTIETSGNDLLTLINDILDISKIEAGRLELQPRRVRLAPLLEKIAQGFRASAESKGLMLAVKIDPDVPQDIETDPQRLEQVLKNFVSNAIKFTDRGEVALEVHRQERHRIGFTVRDTGPGIAPEQQDAIFEAFRQEDGTISRKYGGTGLGLSISRELARLLGGGISLDSTPGQGSAFTLDLPDAYDPASVLPPPPAAAAPLRPASPPPPATAMVRPAASEDDREVLSGDARVILVVEDDPVFARILSDLAHEMGFQCLIAGTADEGALMARQYLPHAVILDMNLPDHTGLSVLDRIKRDTRTRHIPVHVVSVDDDTLAALSSGAVGYLLKPVRRESLVGMLEGLEARMDQRLRRVLVVEDDVAQAESVRHLLASRDVETVEAHSAAACLERLGSETFDCMVLDLNLPDMPGLDLLEKLSTDESVGFPPVIVYTGRDLSAEEELRLRRYSKSIIVKGAKSPERLLDEVTLFLHQVVADLPEPQQKLLAKALTRDAALEGRHILVVEDDIRNVYALTSILEPHGARVRIARNGLEALNELEKAARGEALPVELVLMDVMMPEMDGLTATREIRKQGAWRALPIIALTAKAMARDQQDCLDAGANDYLAKPLDVDKLLSLVRVWMPR
ncbi:response regulator [Novosphingobium sp. KCTC 2891]|uniref:response regulator n=1 Tax=Novosphingobium sp. KCTC 2891 TaxID=2989730 RepID=UPI0022239420|nr:response regulator [Novosphingobium sp. KCTC 2891]MCW1381922.1 response regulator [Novosphingobium sp. KCTC 2891]